jgi:predicted membrane channel-forming protein YqfA (hemolysin III family)
MKKIQLLLVIFTLLPTPAFAYIGPGAGLGAIATLIAIVLGGILLIVGFVWYPLKRILNKRRQTQIKISTENVSGGGDQ